MTSFDLPATAFLPPYPEITALLPHRGTMLLLNALCRWSREDALCLARVEASAWYADAQGAMPAWIGVELMAQTVGVHVALISLARGLPVKPGVLLGTRKYETALSAFPAGAELQVSAHHAYRDDSGIAAYDCEIHLGGQSVAQASLTAYQPDDFAQFLEGNPK